MTPTREQMEKAKEYLVYVKSKTTVADMYIDIPAIETALSALDALLDAGEVLPPLRKGDSFTPLQDMAYNKARSEDIAIVAKKLAGLEEVIALVLSQLLVKDEPDKLGYTKARAISERVSQHLKGGRVNEDNH